MVWFGLRFYTDVLLATRFMVPPLVAGCGLLAGGWLTGWVTGRITGVRMSSVAINPDDYIHFQLTKPLGQTLESVAPDNAVQTF